ncbi:MAG TPA: helix-turn-helix transcriptional regulator [Polyangiaceae bacterium]|jgi:transcriptional regulator with XRE-family HTH domain|nr:helix-turn-helix transcriptional regulator [Polyangiaceae bacterium]
MQAPEALRKWRTDASLTQIQAAEKVGVSGPTWSDWENGKKFPRNDRAEDLEKLTGGSVTMPMWAAWVRRRTKKAARRKAA